MIEIGAGAVADNSFGGGALSTGSRRAECAVHVRTILPRVFDYGGGQVEWQAIVMIREIDVSSRITGKMTIQRAENSAGIAEFNVVPRSVAELSAFDCADVFIEYLIRSKRSEDWSRIRRFHGKVEAVEFDYDQRIAKIICRDGYLDRIKSCKSADEVAALVPNAFVDPRITTWDAANPDPVSYFDALASTVCGSAFISGSNVWNTTRWDRETDLLVFSGKDIFDATLSIRGADKRSIPASIRATLTCRVKRLHCAEVPLRWEAFGYDRFLLDGLSYPNKATILSVLAGASGWYVKNEAEIVGPEPGVHFVINNGNSTPFVFSEEVAKATAIGLSVTMYHRWYQEIDMRYVVDIPLGGGSDRDDTVSISIASDWDAGGWESAPDAKSNIGIYLRGGPAVVEVKTGYEGLPAPYPPANSAIDYAPDIDLSSSLAVLCARALRAGVSGLRKRQFSFEKPIDPRIEIGCGVALTKGQFYGRGRVVSFIDVLDHDNGSASTRVDVSCPQGRPQQPNDFSVPSVDDLDPISHVWPSPTLGNFIGGSVDTPEFAPDNQIIGWLTNCNPLGRSAKGSAPLFVEQFRLIMPEIDAVHRDPETIERLVNVKFQIASGELVVEF